MRYKINPLRKNSHTIRSATMDVETQKVYVFYQNGKEVARYREDELACPPVESLDLSDEEISVMGQQAKQLGQAGLNYPPHLERSDP